MSVTVVIGEQRGDEGKGRFVDMLAAEHDIVARFNGGNNAGHTVVLPDERVLKLHLIPSGIAHPGVINVIGNGVLIDVVKLCQEIEYVKSQGIELNPDNLKISADAHLNLPQYVSADEIREAGRSAQGSTKSGIAQGFAAKALRSGKRMGDILSDSDDLNKLIVDELAAQKITRAEKNLQQLDEKLIASEYLAAAQKLIPYITDTSLYLNEKLNKPRPVKILAEGAQAFLLDIDHGMYPYTTSSSTTSGGVATGLGIPPTSIKRIIGISKATQSHVGGGPFVTEITDSILLKKLHGDTSTVDAERGTTTGRTRRLGYLDLPAIRRSQMINGTTEMALTKLDWVPRYGKIIKICTSYVLDDKKIEIAPSSAADLERSKPVYQELASWTEDISNIRRFKDLPHEAQKYIKFIENELGTKISMIGVGPNRNQVIHLQ